MLMLLYYGELFFEGGTDDLPDNFNIRRLGSDQANVLYL
jgi:hypothetical protein